MISVDEIKEYLPKYLSPESEKKLFDELKAFPDNIDDRLYTIFLKQNSTIFQGDGIESVFYLPKYGSLKNDSLVFLDRVGCCEVDYLNGADLSEIRQFTLSQYGHYLFIFKLSMHFTRINEGVDREVAQ